MSKRPLNDDERAELVAYLDGEATGPARRAVEQKLSLDPVWRAEAESLRRTWDLLDFLPRPEPSPSFTERTLSKLVPVRKPTANGAPKKPKWGPAGWALLAGGWAAAAVLAAGVGYQSYRALATRGPGEAELIRDLRIIENKHFYDAVEDIDFLRELDQPDLFGEDATGG